MPMVADNKQAASQKHPHHQTPTSLVCVHARGTTLHFAIKETYNLYVRLHTAQCKQQTRAHATSAATDVSSPGTPAVRLVTNATFHINAPLMCS
jgi:hypothetical protein